MEGGGTETDLEWYGRPGPTLTQTLTRVAEEGVETEVDRGARVEQAGLKIPSSEKKTTSAAQMGLKIFMADLVKLETSTADQTKGLKRSPELKQVQPTLDSGQGLEPMCVLPPHTR